MVTSPRHRSHRAGISSSIMNYLLSNSWFQQPPIGEEIRTQSIETRDSTTTTTTTSLIRKKKDDKGEIERCIMLGATAQEGKSAQALAACRTLSEELTEMRFFLARRRIFQYELLDLPC
ncbi:protein transport protein sec23-1 isoform X2 [Cucumis melo var. makuwa]|uniref:Protein transport protein sec23-1 isoform X2 n=1 Tax=Cucumis melo var. makuwa TaxID=1194695 RepID=A0A5A7UJS9_CUCMM|nr:protein transport protein sec23-1 isoform X2 [Cucumis melo var. makuwa]TYK26334.1 protein transport protein sec23-1 isoform X2 [Cucumis melo var. makuwa]